MLFLCGIGTGVGRGRTAPSKQTLQKRERCAQQFPTFAALASHLVHAHQLQHAELVHLAAQYREEKHGN